MSVQLSMVGLMVEDMGRALAFYRRLGVDIPPDSDNETHVQARMEGGLTLFWDTAFDKVNDSGRRVPPVGGYRILLEFFLPSAAAVDAMYQDLTEHGYTGHREPFKASFGAYMTMVDDPDGNTILITAG